MHANQLALSMGRALQKKQTGFVHYCPQSEDFITHDTIPTYENALFALALFRSRLSDHVLEGKAIIEKLLFFEVDGNFPVFLHDYPNCSDPYLGFKLLPIFFWLTIDFSHVIGQLKQKLEKLIERILQNPLELPTWAKGRLEAFEGKATFLIENLSESLISLQIAEKKGAQVEKLIEQACQLWHPELSLYVGEGQCRHQMGYYPETTLYDLYMCQWQKKFSKRVEIPHPVHLRGALIRPLNFEPHFQDHPVPFISHDPFFIAWNEHTLIQSKNAFYLNYHSDHQFFVEEEKSVVFHEGEIFEICSKDLEIHLSFKAKSGKYMGHLMRGNRPAQHLNRGENLHTAFDWKITIREILPGDEPIQMLVQCLPKQGSQQPLPSHASHCLHIGSNL